MYIYNSSKIKKQINEDLDDRIKEHMIKYNIELRANGDIFRRNRKDISSKSTIDLEDNNVIIYEKLEDKVINNEEYKKKEYKSLSYMKIEFDEFINCKFENLIFKNCTFKGSSFYKCTFKNVIFEDCNFFYEDSITVFEKGCTFMETTFKNCNIKRNIFKNCVFEKSKFINCNMRDSIFCNTQIHNIYIADSDCRSFKVLESCIKNLEFEDEYITKFDEYTFIDEIENDEKSIKSYEEISRVYKSISTKFENNNLLNHAGEYYYKSKKEERKTLKGIEKIKSYLFWMVCGYGEKPAYALITSMEIVLIFAILYMFTGLRTGDVVIDYSTQVIEGLIHMPNLYSDFGKSLYFSITTFTTVGYGDVTPIGWSVFLSGIQMFLGVTMVGLWTATLARKIIR